MAQHIQIPEGEERPLLRVAHWSDEEFSKFLAAIRNRHSPSSDALRTSVSEQDESPKTSGWDDVLGTILGISKVTLNMGQKPKAVVEGLSDQLGEFEELTTAQETTFINRLTKLLTEENVLTVSQTDIFLSLKGDFLRRAQVSTQLEPIYAIHSHQTKPSGFIIMQELWIETTSPSDEKVATFRCLLDIEDLKSLKERINEAMLRRQALEKMLETSSFSFETADMTSEEGKNNENQ